MPPTCLYSVPSLAHISQAELKLDIFHKFLIGLDPASTDNLFLLCLGTVDLILYCSALCEDFDTPLLGTCLAGKSRCVTVNVSGGLHSPWFLYEDLLSLCCDRPFSALLHTGLCTGMCLRVEGLFKEGPKYSENPGAIWVGLSEWGWQTAISSKHSVGALS